MADHREKLDQMMKRLEVERDELKVKLGLAKLEAAGIEVRRVSAWIETEPVGGPAGQGRYLNGVLEASVTLGARELLGLLAELETAAGRDRSREERNGPRTLDLDLLLFGDEAIADPDLVVPHPRLEERVFVLQPLASLAPDQRLPSGRTATERLSELTRRERSVTSTHA